MTNLPSITSLLVDDDDQNLAANAHWLHEMELYNYLQAESGPEALAMYNNFSPHLIVCKQDLPQISGLSLLRTIRRLEYGNDEATKVVLYGVDFGAQMVAQAGRAGVNAILVMPLEARSFKEKIQNVLMPPIDPKDIEAERLYEQGLEQMNKGEYEKALELFTSVLETSENAEVYFNLGYIKSIKGEYEEALRCFQRAITINKRHARAYKQIGLIYEKIGQKEKAGNYLEKSGELHLEWEQDNEAEDIFNNVLRINPGTINVYNSLGIIYRRQGRLQESVIAYEKAQKVHPNDEHILFNLGRVYIELKDFPKARAALKKALALNTRFSAAAELLRAAELGLSLKT